MIRKKTDQDLVDEREEVNIKMWKKTNKRRKWWLINESSYQENCKENREEKWQTESSICKHNDPRQKIWQNYTKNKKYFLEDLKANI